MPRGFDSRLPLADWDPLANKLNLDTAGVLEADLLAEFEKALEVFFNMLIQAFDKFTGFDLSEFIPLIDGDLQSLARLFGDLTPAGGFNIPDAIATFWNLVVTNALFLPRLPMMMIDQLPEFFEGFAISAGVANLPLLEQLIAATGGTGSTLTDFASLFDVAITDVTGLLSGGKVDLSLIPNLPATIINSGTFLAGQIPFIDASKVNTGVFSTGLIPNLPASIINSGTFATSLIPNITKAMSTDLQSVITNIFGTSAIGTVLATGAIPNLPSSKMVSYWLSQMSGSNMVIDPSFENPGQWGGMSPPNIQIVTTRAHSGTRSMQLTGPQAVFLLQNDSGALQVKTRPGEKYRFGAWIWGEAANAGTGSVFFTMNCYGADGTSFLAQLNSTNYATLTKGQWNYVEFVHTIPANIYYFYAYLYTPAIPATDSYFFDDVLVREETTAQSIIQQLYGGTTVLSSILASAVPFLDASKLNTGVLNLLRLPNMPASQITSGVFGTSLIPNLPATIINSGTFLASQIPFIDASKVNTGVFTTGVIPNLPISQINTLPGQLATMFSPFNPPQVIGTGQVASVTQNLLLNPTFADPNSMAGELVWTWDAATPDGIGGSAKVLANANANAKSLLSNPIQVVAGDTINASAYTQWSSLVYTGTPISLMLNVYDANNALINTVTMQAATMTGATSSWVQLIGNHLITETGAAWVRLRFDVSTAATAGSVWFGKGTLTKPNLVPQSAVSGLPSLATIPGAIIDTGVQAIVNDAALVNQSLAVFNAQVSNLRDFIGYVTSGAAPPNSVAHIASNVDNTVKARAVQAPTNRNIDPTTVATFDFSEVWQINPLPTIAITSAVTAMGDITIRDGGNRLAATWYGYPTGGNFGSITDFRVNIYTVNRTTLVRTRVHQSANLVASVGTGTAPVFNSYNFPSAIVCEAGDMLTAELAILGTGTYNVVGQTLSPQVPIHPTYGLHAMTRASAAAPATMNPPGVGGSPASYSRNVAWLGLSGVQAATQYTPVIIPFYSSGTFDPSIYQWANYIDIVVCGPGGNGQAGSGYWGGMAGTAGGWNAATIAKAVWGAVTTSVNITGGGSQTASTITVPGWGTLSGPAGTNANTVSGTNNMGQAPAPGPYDENYDGTNYHGGAGGQTPQANGEQPGGAGAGGNAPFTVGTYIGGGGGGAGIGYIKVYQ